MHSKSFPETSNNPFLRQKIVNYVVMIGSILISIRFIMNNEIVSIIAGCVIFLFGVLQFLFDLYRKRYFIKSYIVDNDTIKLLIFYWNKPVIDKSFSRKDLQIRYDQDPYERFTSTRITLIIDSKEYRITQDRFWQEEDARFLVEWYKY